MKIAFDAKRLFHNHTGLGNYSRSLVKYLREVDAENELYLFTPSLEKTEYSEFLTEMYHIVNGKKRFLWRLKNMVKDIEKVRPHIYHGLSNELPIGIKKLDNVKSIVTIHDLIFLKFPHFYPRVDQILYREKTKRACKDADHIIAVSQATKNDIIEHYNISVDKISVIYQGFDEIFSERDTYVEERKEPYFLFVGSINERKNLQLILLALATFENNKRPLLKVVGTGGEFEKKMRNMVRELKIESNIEFLGQVNNALLKSLYVNAISLIYPSFYEGFGIPIVESMLCGTPVITSNVSAMPEAALGFGKLIDPESVDELRAAMLEVIHDRKKMTDEEILKVYQKFNPLSHANEVLDLYKSLVNVKIDN